VDPRTHLGYQIFPLLEIGGNYYDYLFVWKLSPARKFEASGRGEAIFSVGDEVFFDLRKVVVIEG
jgi:hypothetical protein